MDKKSTIPVHEAMKKIASKSNGKRPVVLHGFVSEANGENVRFHTQLDPTSYLDIPTSAILHSSFVEDCNGKRNRLVIDRDVELTLVSKDTVTGGDLVDHGGNGVSAMINLRNIGIKLYDKVHDFIDENKNCMSHRLAYDRAKAFLEDNPGLSRENRENIDGYMQDLLRYMEEDNCPAWSRP